MPGLIDVHVHLQFDGSADFEKESKELTTPGHAAIKAVVNAKRNLEAGVTTVRDLGGMGGASIDVAQAVAAGLIPGPRILAAGRALTVTGGHGHNIALSRQVDGADAVRAAVWEEIRDGASAIKLIATGGVLTPGIPATFSAFTAEELEGRRPGSARTRSSRRGARDRCERDPCGGARRRGLDRALQPADSRDGPRDDRSRYVPVADDLRRPRDPRSREPRP
jgi:hypothetical protein